MSVVLRTSVVYEFSKGQLKVRIANLGMRRSILEPKSNYQIFKSCSPSFYRFGTVISEYINHLSLSK